MMESERNGTFRNLRFSDIWKTSKSFAGDYASSELAPVNNKISDSSARTLYYLLYSKYGNSTIASFDPNQFKYKVFSLIFQYGPTWEKRLELQHQLRALTDADLMEGTKNIYNHAANPATQPTTEELDYISDQTVSKMRRSKIDAYSTLYDMLRADITSVFLAKFKDLFIQVVAPDMPLYYADNEFWED